MDESWQDIEAEEFPNTEIGSRAISLMMEGLADEEVLAELQRMFPTFPLNLSWVARVRGKWRPPERPRTP